MTRDAIELPHFRNRQRHTALMWEELERNVQIEKAKAPEDIFDRGCAYVTGSLARDEATMTSDLDLFIVDSLPLGGESWASPMTRPEEAHFLSAVDTCRRRTGFRPFSQRGRFVSTHSFMLMVQAIGNAEDDFTNRFTARMLMLLNSRPLINEQGYNDAREMIMDFYWRQQPDRHAPFLPVFLLNDIRRWWSIVLLNFEFHNPPATLAQTGENDRQRRAQRRVNNLKLRHARVMAAWTPIIGILVASEDRGITRSQLMPILNDTPVDRLLRLLDLDISIAEKAEDVLVRYDRYLAFMDCSKEELFSKVMEDNWSDEVKPEAYEFGDSIAALLQEAGRGKLLYRYVQV